MEYKTPCTKMVKTIEDPNGIQDPVYFLGKKQLKTLLDRNKGHIRVKGLSLTKLAWRSLGTTLEG